RGLERWADFCAFAFGRPAFLGWAVARACVLERVCREAWACGLDERRVTLVACDCRVLVWRTDVALAVLVRRWAVTWLLLAVRALLRVIRALFVAAARFAARACADCCATRLEFLAAARVSARVCADCWAARFEFLAPRCDCWALACAAI